MNMVQAMKEDKINQIRTFAKFIVEKKRKLLFWYLNEEGIIQMYTFKYFNNVWEWVVDKTMFIKFIKNEEYEIINEKYEIENKKKNNSGFVGHTSSCDNLVEILITLLCDFAYDWNYLVYLNYEQYYLSYRIDYIETKKIPTTYQLPKTNYFIGNHMFDDFQTENEALQYHKASTEQYYKLRNEIMNGLYVNNRSRYDIIKIQYLPQPTIHSSIV